MSSAIDMAASQSQHDFGNRCARRPRAAIHSVGIHHKPACLRTPPANGNRWRLLRQYADSQLWGRVQTELVNTRKWSTVEQPSVAITDYIENFHNPRGRHSTLDILTPTEFGTLNTQQMHHA